MATADPLILPHGDAGQYLRHEIGALLATLGQDDAPPVAFRLPARGPEPFLDAAVRAILDSPVTAGTRRLVALLARDHRFLQFLLDPVTCRNADAIAVARSSGTVFEIELDRELNLCLDAHPPDEDRLVRLLSLFEAAGAERRCAWLQGELLSSPSLLVRSKAAKILARGNHRTALATRLLHDADPRVQASAVESLWSSADPGVARLLLEALNSPHHRVAGNAAVGLHHIDQLHAVAALRNLLHHPDLRFRITGAWAMGETGDPRFLDHLAALVTEPGGIPRLTILRALSRIRVRQRHVEALGPLEICLHEACVTTGGARRLRFSLLPASGPADLRAVEITLREGGRDVSDFHLQVQPHPAVLVVGFVLPPLVSPAGQDAAAVVANCRRFQRPQDVWRTVNYRTGDRVVLEAVNRITAPMTSTPGQRHLFVVVDGAQNRPSTRLVERVAKRLERNRIALHAFLPPGSDCDELRAVLESFPNNTLEELHPKDLPHRLESACATLLNGYELTYTLPTPPATGALAISSTAAGAGALEYELAESGRSAVSRQRSASYELTASGQPSATS